MVRLISGTTVRRDRAVSQRGSAGESRRRPLGNVVLAQAVPVKWLISLLCLLVVAFSVFVSLGSYARKETVRGYLSPDPGVARIHAPRPGLVHAVHVGERQFVRRGDPLVSLRGETVTGGGVIADEEILRTTESQIREIERQISLERVRRRADESRLSSDLRGLAKELRLTGDQVAMQRQLVNNLSGEYEQLAVAVKQGVISKAQFLRREESLLAAKQVLLDLETRYATIATRMERQELELARVPADSESRVSILKSGALDLEARRIELSARRTVTITAPVAGIVAALQAVPGSTVSTSLQLLTILPEDGQLEARLFVPSRAIGFVEPGQEVRILFEAFDYRRYGIQKGTVSAVAPFVLSPLEVRGWVAVNEPTYRVDVALADDVVPTAGGEMPLRPGMMLTADIVFERRSLLYWIFEPLHGVRNRI